MPAWTTAYLRDLQERLDKITGGLPERLDAIADGRIAPAVDDIAIGSGRKVRGSVLFFDIRNFTQRTNSADVSQLKETLHMLDVVIPMVMHVVFDHGGYVEKNTGDGVMAVFGIGQSDDKAANTALDVATISFYVLRNVVNPYLVGQGIDSVDARIGIGMGTLLLARIGTPKGASTHDRSHLTAVGPPANVASKLQHMAGTNEIWVDDLVRTNAASYRSGWFFDKTPADWSWTWTGGDSKGQRYRLWRYTGERQHPT